MSSPTCCYPRRNSSARELKVLTLTKHAERVSSVFGRTTPISVFITYIHIRMIKRSVWRYRIWLDRVWRVCKNKQNKNKETNKNRIGAYRWQSKIKNKLCLYIRRNVLCACMHSVYGGVVPEVVHVCIVFRLSNS